MDLLNSDRPINYLEELLKTDGAELKIGDKSLVWNYFSGCYSILNYSSGIEEIEANFVELKDVKKIMVDE